MKKPIREPIGIWWRASAGYRNPEILSFQIVSVTEKTVVKLEVQFIWNAPKDASKVYRERREDRQ